MKTFLFNSEKYTRGVSAVESILVLDRLRQSVAVKEIEQTQCKQQLSMRKTASVPNFSQVNILLSFKVLVLAITSLHNFQCHCLFDFSRDSRCEITANCCIFCPFHQKKSFSTK